MAKRALHFGGRRSGWPPERSGQPRRGPLASDDVALVILWIAVLAGFLLVVFVALSTLFGWDVGLASTADAATIEDTNSGYPGPGARPLPSNICAEAPPETQSLPDAVAVQQVVVSGTPLTDISPSVGVTLGRVVQASLHSDILDMDLPYRVYLPPGYDFSNRRYPTLYLLHGNGASVFAEWTDDNKIGVIADAMIAAGKVDPMIIVMPDGEHSYWMNHFGDGERWQDYVLYEVIPFFDANFRTIPDKAHRAIGGHSMGGAGALSIGLTHPELFAAVGAHSPSLRWSPEGGMPYFGPDWYFSDYNPLDIAETATGLATIKIWIDYGVDDPWLEDGAGLNTILQSRGIDYQWHLYPGNHYVGYWIEHGPEYLEFYSAAFSASDSPAGQAC